jgi:L-amino acid N-acyltransferase YncA
VLVETDEVLGFVNIGPSREEEAVPETGEVTSIYLEPEVWGTGGGRLLMDEALGLLEPLGSRNASPGCSTRTVALDASTKSAVGALMARSDRSTFKGSP